jgi:DNA invertase Pin-like site-specific DNA recombinase
MSREDQVTEADREAARHNIEVIATLIEPPSTSAFKDRGRRRPEWPKLLELVRNGKVQVVIAYKTDRLSRGGGPGWAPLIEAAEHAGLNPDRFVLIVGSGFMSEFEIGIRATMDREESKKTSDRISTVRARIASQGLPTPGGARPFGYAKDQMTIVEEEAELLRSAARRILAGENVNAICREWNEAGITTSGGGQWYHGTLKTVLTTPRVVALREYRSPSRRKSVESVVGPAVWPAILDRPTWERLRARLWRPERRPNERGSVYLLTGFLVCGKPFGPDGEICGHKMFGNTPTPGRNAGLKHSKYTYRARYMCPGSPGLEACGSNSILAEPAETYVTEQALDKFESKEFVATLRRRRRDDINLADREAEIVELEAHLMYIAEEYGADPHRKAEYRRMRDTTQARLNQALAAVIPLREATVIDDLGDLKTLRERWPGLGVDRQRAGLSIVMDRIVVGPVVKKGSIHGRGLDKIDWLV